MMSLPRRTFLQCLLTSAIPVVGRSQWRSQEAHSLYRRALVIDALSSVSSFDPASRDDYAPLSSRHLAEVKASGVTAINLTVGAVGNGPHQYQESMRSILFYEKELARYPDLFLKVRKSADIRAAKATGKVGIIYGFQDTSMLEGDLSRLDQFEAIGVKIIQPVYNRRNLMGDGCLEPANGGLSTLGQDLIGELNRRRILVDLSHAGHRVQSEAIALSNRPCAITHSGCRELVDLPRNTADVHLRMLADKGGVMGIYFMPFLSATGRQTSADVIRHIEHAVKVAGEDHVGIGTDGGIPAVTDLNAYRQSLKQDHDNRLKLGIAAQGERAESLLLVPEYNSARRLEQLADDLLRRGHRSSRVEKILGGNFARLFQEVWG